MPRKKKLPPGVVQHGDKFRYRVMANGRRRNSHVFDTAEQAYQASLIVKKQLAKSPGKRVTLKEGFQHVLDRGGIRPGTVIQYREKFAILAREFSEERALTAIHEDRLKRYLKKREDDGVTGTTISKELVMLNRIFRVCIEDGLVESNPIPVFRSKFSGRLKTRKKPPRFVTMEEFASVYKKMEAWTLSRGTDLERDRFIPLVLFHTGLRRSELGRLAIEDIDLQNSTIYPDGKTHDATVHISKALKPVLASYIKRKGLTGSDLLVGDAKEIANCFRRWKDRLKIDWTPHAMRHGLGASLAAKGAHPKIIQEVLRHKTAAMSMHYQSITDKAARSAVDDLLG